MNILFWNINRKNLIQELRSISLECDPDIIVLAECQISDAFVLSTLNVNIKRKYQLPVNPSSRLNIYVRLNRDAVVPLTDSGGIAIRHITPPLGLDFILVAIHLPSKLHYDQSDHFALSIRLSDAIYEAESRVGHDRTIVIGDFNMNPFEDGLISADGLHAVMDRKTAMSENRIVQGEKKKFFYNPMWSRIGDLSEGPPGTYHYQSSKQLCFFWNTFDQILIRPSLLNYFSEENLKVITKFNGTNLLSAGGKPDTTNFSDHLPIFINLKTEEVI
jgi:hypothetical protein